jgi:hypothetical protein
VFVALALWVSLAVVASGQTPPSDEPAAPAEVPGTPPRQSWQGYASALGVVDSNVSFQSPDSPGDYGLSLETRLSRLFRSRRGELNLDLEGDALVYRELTEFNHVDAALRLAGSHRSSLKVVWSYGGNAGYQTTDTLPILIDQGLQFARAHALSLGANAGIDFRISRDSSLRFGGQFERISFDSPTLVDTRSADGSLALARRLGPRDELSLSYGYRYAGGPDLSDSIHELTLRWNRPLTRRFAFDVGGGEGFAPASAAQPQGRWFLVGAAGVQGKVRRAVLSVRISREAISAYGLGDIQLSDILSLMLSVPFGRRLTILASTTGARSRDLHSGDLRETSAYANISLAIRLARHTCLALGYRYRYNDPIVAVSVDSHRASFGFTYGLP